MMVKRFSAALGFVMACELLVGLGTEAPAQSQPFSSRLLASETVGTRSQSSQREMGECREMPDDGQQVASGSISSRWTYQIFRQRGRNQFYVRYWPQNNCDQVVRTHTFATQREAYEYFRDVIGEGQAY